MARGEGGQSDAQYFISNVFFSSRCFYLFSMRFPTSLVEEGGRGITLEDDGGARRGTFMFLAQRLMFYASRVAVRSISSKKQIQNAIRMRFKLQT